MDEIKKFMEETSKQLNLMTQRMDSFVEQIAWVKSARGVIENLSEENKKEMLGIKNSLNSSFNRLYDQTTHGRLEEIEKTVIRWDETILQSVKANIEELAVNLGGELVVRDKRLEEVEKLVKELAKKSNKVHKLFEEYNFLEILNEIKKLDLEYQDKLRGVLMSVKVKEKKE